MKRFFSRLLLSSALAGVLIPVPPLHAEPILLAARLADQPPPALSSQSALIINTSTGETLYQKNSERKVSIASITKLMTAMVILDSGLNLNEPVTISEAEIDRLKNTHSRLSVGTTLTRRELLLLALMSSENRAAAALARSYPGGTSAFVARMNRKARALGMRDTEYYDATGLDSRNLSTAHDLAIQVRTAYQHYPLIRSFSTSQEHLVSSNGHTLQYRNSNALVREGSWDIGVQKTGYIQEAGRCVVMQANVGSQPLVIILLAAQGSAARTNDAKALKSWLEAHPSYWLAG